MTFERTRDWELIRAIATNKAIYPHISDDFSPEPEDFEPLKHESIWYVLAKDGAEILGMWIFTPHNAICWEVHTCLLPSAWGQRAKQAAKEMARWLWKNTECLRLITDVPQCNRLAYKFALAAGMMPYGVNQKAFMKNGELHDVILLGLSKGVPCP